MGFLGQHDSFGSWHLCICSSLLIFNFSTFLCLLVWVLYAILLREVLLRVEPLDYAIVFFLSAWFLLLTPLCLTLFMLNSFSIARYVLSSLEGQSLKYSVNLLLTYSTFSVLMLGLAVWLELFANSVCCFLSQTSYLFSPSFIRDCYSITLPYLT